MRPMTRPASPVALATPLCLPGLLFALAALPLLPGSLGAQPYTGTWETANSTGGTTVVTLQQVGDNVSGTLSGSGTTARLQGVLEDGVVVGSVTGGPIELRLWFEAEVEDGGLLLTLISSLPDGSPNYDETTTLLFERRTAGGEVSAAPGAGGGGVGAGTPPPGGGDPWLGIFSDGSVTLDLQGGNGRYSGTVRVAGQEFPLEVQGGATELQGAFRTADGDFPVTLRRTGAELILTTDGVSYPLRVAGAPVAAPAPAAANPLAPGGGRQGGSGQPSAPAPATVATATPGGAAAPSRAAGGLPHDGTPLGQEWFQHLAGKMATQMSRYDGGGGGGMTSRTDVHLCPGGEFAMRGNSQVGIDVGDVWAGAGGPSASSGHWRILTQGNVAGIELTFGNGTVELYRLDYQNGQTLVDGQRWLVTPSNLCGG